MKDPIRLVTPTSKKGKKSSCSPSMVNFIHLCCSLRKLKNNAACSLVLKIKKQSSTYRLYISGLKSKGQVSSHVLSSKLKKELAREGPRGEPIATPSILSLIHI